MRQEPPKYRATGPASRYRLAALLIALFIFPLHATQAAEQLTEHWELRVCAEPDNLPYSNRNGEGFENAIASILAEHLGAKLVYAWMPLPIRDSTAALMLRFGECDLMLGVIDGQEPLLTTVTYYRGITVFVTPADSPLKITSLDDPVLTSLRLGVPRGSPADYSLLQRGMLENVQHFLPDDPPEATLEQVVNGELDAALAWGPTAGYYASQLKLPVTLTPVTPEVDMPFLPMTQPFTIGVRRTDHAFRDLLDRAIVDTWDDIQQVITDYNIQHSPLPPPRQGAAVSEQIDWLRIGVVLPALTGEKPLHPLGPELLGEPARQGAILADEAMGDEPDLPLAVLIASAPDAETAVRAARRLIAAQHVDALIGGIGPGQAEALSALAEEFGLPFLNIGDSGEDLHSGACEPTTFTIAASSGMYLQALAAELLSSESRSWHVIQVDTPVWSARAQQLAKVLAEQIPAGVATSSLVTADTPLFISVFDAIRRSSADTVILLLEADSQLVFLSQYESARLDASVLAFPVAVTQTRQFYSALLQDAPDTGSGPRIALWEANLQNDGAMQLNKRYLARWGTPMDPAAWAAYTAVHILVSAVKATGAPDRAGLLSFLSQPNMQLDVKKATPAFFDQWHKLQQPLYEVQLDPQAELGRSAFKLLQLAQVTRTIAVPVQKSTSPHDCSPAPH